jgi:PTH1 family peptidyl-tRNA hydrolase
VGYNAGVSRDRWLIVGLGNPGREYAHNRHNVGYWCVNRLARLHGIKLKAYRLAALGEGEIAGVPVLLVKPRTYVNRSGDAVGAAIQRFKGDPHRVVVLYDELDLPSGTFRMRPSGGSGGHNGIKSIIAALGTEDFPRIRIGIGRPHIEGEPTWEPRHVGDWVLSDPTPAEVEILRNAVARAAEAVETLVTEGVDVAMTRFNP